MPAFNEEENIQAAIVSAHRVLRRITTDYELLVVDDGSTDRTATIGKRLEQKFSRFRLIQHPRNLGYGEALRTGIHAATKSYTFYTDADNQFDISVLPQIVKRMKPQQMVIGYRVNRQDSWQRLFMSWVYHLIIGRLFGVWVKDINCSFKLFPTSLFQTHLLSSKTVFIDAEMVILAKKAGYSITEVPITHFKRQGGSSKFELGKKGVAMVVHPGKVWGIIREITHLYPELR